MPESVLRRAAQDMLDWRDRDGRSSGMSVMEMSHRGREFISICEQAEADFRALLSVPEHFHILFMQGGGLGENAFVPLNLSRGGAVDFVISGSWSIKSHKEAQRYCKARVAASNAEDGHTRLPDPSGWRLSSDAAYVHVCSNETINGLEFHTLPDLAALGSTAPLVIDFSSHVASRPVDWSRVGLAFGGAQKNLGPAGLTLVVVRDDLLGHALEVCPSAFNFRTVADNESMYNTPPTWAIYMAGLTFQWLLAQSEAGLTGIAAMEHRNKAKAALLYDFLDGSDFYANKVDPVSRSRMNVPFFLADESRNPAFLDGARAAGLLQLKGHKSVGGMRASIYNAMPLEGVQALVTYMREFERLHA
ncbi:MAG: 3-phosphoserine/phosphohydroxythreonine transaminase [Comamonadaceae bacterium]|nr:MAG: 3-phosphoserine/phosphohydroxythreonine transaminase [Comamonadaceae bacterium]